MCVLILSGRDAALWQSHRAVILPWRKGVPPVVPRAAGTTGDLGESG